MSTLKCRTLSAATGRVQTAAELCHRLVDFCQRLTTAKRKILEDPDLYPEHTKHALPDSDATRLTPHPALSYGDIRVFLRDR
jgi:hypothetical protein